ncbi:MAG: 50S ribosomal protein L18 [Deltaproteobacteria bacterium]|nr:50S ribosomal protein L18 [Deltaproteobacteria bacterium]
MGDSTVGTVFKSTKFAAEKRRRRIGAKVRLHAGDRHILSVSRSARHIYAQVSDPEGHTLFGISTRSKEFRALSQSTGNISAAKQVGQLVAEKAIEKGYRRVVFNRNGYLYHGRVKALADAAREAGLDF